LLLQGLGHAAETKREEPVVGGMCKHASSFFL
jgi:hypothetical protein